MTDPRLTAPALTGQEAMSKALVAYHRQVGEDGIIGSELVTALLLAVAPAPVVVEPWVILGRPR